MISCKIVGGVVLPLIINLLVTLPARLEMTLGIPLGEPPDYPLLDKIHELLDLILLFSG